MVSTLGKKSADILKYFSYLSRQKGALTLSDLMQIVNIKCQSLFSGKNKKNYITNLLSADFAQRVGKVSPVIPCLVLDWDQMLFPDEELYLSTGGTHCQALIKKVLKILTFQ